jgi:ribosomal protein L6P/L9E
MSRIGRKVIEIPTNVELEAGAVVHVKGPLGELSFRIPKGIKAEKTDNILKISRSDDEKETKALHGLTRSLVFNMVEGVSKGFREESWFFPLDFLTPLKSNHQKVLNLQSQTIRLLCQELVKN